MTDCMYADFLQNFMAKQWEVFEFDLVLLERLSVLAEPESFQPLGDIFRHP